MVLGAAGLLTGLQMFYGRFGVGSAASGLFTAFWACVCYIAALFIPKDSIGAWARTVGTLGVALYIGNISLVAVRAISLLLEQFS